MSWWWMAPLGVGAGGAGVLGVVAHGLREESARLARSSEGLTETLGRLSEARRQLRVDFDHYHPTETTPAPR
jgi:hypothetical protein